MSLTGPSPTEDAGNSRASGQGARRILHRTTLQSVLQLRGFSISVGIRV